MASHDTFLLYGKQFNANFGKLRGKSFTCPHIYHIEALSHAFLYFILTNCPPLSLDIFVPTPKRCELFQSNTLWHKLRPYLKTSNILPVADRGSQTGGGVLGWLQNLAKQFSYIILHKGVATNADASVQDKQSYIEKTAALVNCEQSHLKCSQHLVDCVLSFRKDVCTLCQCTRVHK